VGECVDLAEDLLEQTRHVHRLRTVLRTNRRFAHSHVGDTVGFTPVVRHERPLGGHVGRATEHVHLSEEKIKHVRAELQAGST